MAEDVDGARQVMADLAAAGVDFDDVTATLEREGVDSFAQSYQDLIATLEKRTAGARRVAARASARQSERGAEVVGELGE